MADLIQKTDTLNQGREKLNAAITDAEKAKLDAGSAVNTSNQAKQTAKDAETKAESVQEQFNQVVIEGDSSVEAAQARVKADGTSFPTLQARLNAADAQINDIMYNVRSFGAVNDGSENVLPIIKDLVNSIPRNAGLYFPPGIYLWQGDGSELLLIDKPIRLIGAGPDTKIIANPLETGVTDIIRITPSEYGDSWFPGLSSIEGLHFTSGGGTRAKNAIHFVIESRGVMGMTIRNNSFMNIDGYSVALTNPTNNDGFYLNDISQNFANSGMFFERIGDSNIIHHNKIFGKYTGIEMSSVPGANNVVIRENNITSDGGAIKILSGGQVKILYNQCEQVNPYTGDVDAQIYVAGSMLPEIRGNNINGHGNVSRLIRVGNATGTVIDANYLQKSSSFNMILIDSDAVDTQVLDTNKYMDSNGALVDPRIQNGGKGIKSPMANDGWIPAYETWVYKSANRLTVPQDKFIKYAKGDKVKFSQGGVTKYFYIVNVHSATEIEITGGSDYTLTNQTITENFYSKVENPRGFPDWFNHTPTYTGFAANPEATCRFALKGRTCIYSVDMHKAGTSNSAYFQISTPIRSSNLIESTVYAYAAENGNNNPTSAYAKTQKNNPDFVYVTIPYSGFSTSGNKRASFIITYEIA